MSQGIVCMNSYHRPIADVAALLAQSVNVSPLETVSVEAGMFHCHFADLLKRTNQSVHKSNQFFTWV